MRFVLKFRGSVSRAGAGKLVFKNSMSGDLDGGRCDFPLLKDEIIRTIEIQSLIWRMIDRPDISKNDESSPLRAV